MAKKPYRYTPEPQPFVSKEEAENREKTLRREAEAWAWLFSDLIEKKPSRLFLKKKSGEPLADLMREALQPPRRKKS